MKILILAEYQAGILQPATYHTLSAAKELGDDIDILLIGYQLHSIVTEIQKLSGVKRILVADHEVYQAQLAENSAQLLAKIGANYDYILAGASTFSKNLLPRAAALLDTAMLSDVCQIVAHDTFVRPIYAGNVLATIQLLEKIKIFSIRSTAFKKAEINTQQTVAIVPLTEVINNSQSRFVAQALTASVRPELNSARIVIAGGRGLKSAENFRLLEKIADQLGAAIGASRAAVDAGFAPNDYQIGQTGKVIAPDLYIAVGISGAIQHLAGMKDSKCIVAINSDPDAPIFQVADYGMVGDLFKILPELASELEKLHLR